MCGVISVLPGVSSTLSLRIIGAFSARCLNETGYQQPQALSAFQVTYGNIARQTVFDVGAYLMKSQSYQRLEDMERRNALWRCTLLGYPLWPSLRIAAHRSLLLAGYTRSVRLDAGDFRPRLLGALSMLKVALCQPFKPGPGAACKRDIWVLSNSKYRRHDPDRGTVCIYANDLGQQLGERILFIEFDEAKLTTRSDDQICNIDGWRVWAAVIGAVACFGPIRRLITRRLSIDSFAPLSEAMLVKTAVYGRVMQALARYWIRVRRPRAVFVICAYTTMIPVQRAVREAGIPLIELQHGQIHSSHSGYVFGALPEQLHFPDCLVTFGRRFSSLLETASSRWTGRLVVGGHPWLRLKPRGNRTECSDAIRRLVAFGQYDPPVQRQLVDFMCALAELVPSDVELTYKPHPKELDLERITSELNAANVAVLEAGADSREVLATAGSAVTVFSTTAMEALAFNCRSIVLSSPFRTDEIQALVDLGWVDSVSTPAQALALLGRPAEKNLNAAQELFGITNETLDYSKLILDLETRRFPTN